MPIDLILQMVLYAFLPAAASIVGRVYFHYTGLNSDQLTTELQSLLIPTVLLPIAILLLRKGRFSTRLDDVGNLSTLGAWIWFIATAGSMVAHLGVEGVIVSFVTGMLSALLVMYSSRQLPATLRSYELVAVSMLGGSLFPLVFGLRAYYAVWGIPSLSTLMFSRYNLTRIQPYELATFGNTANMGCFCALMSAICIVILLGRICHWTTRLLSAVVLVLIVCNLLIVESRTSWAILGATWLAAVLFRKSGKRGILMSAIAVFAITFVPSSVLNPFAHNMERGITYDESDHSAYQRLDSMRVGWENFLDHPVVGVGPGLTQGHNEYGEAHELVLYAAEETGILGMIAVLLLTVVCTWRVVRMILVTRQDEASILAFAFALGPAMYFIRGLVSEVSSHMLFVNTWICLVFGMMSLADCCFALGKEVSAKGANPKRGTLVLSTQFRRRTRAFSS